MTPASPPDYLGNAADHETDEAPRWLSGAFLLLLPDRWTIAGFARPVGHSFMAKRNLRVTKWIGTVPAVAVCTSCNREFKVPVTAMKRVADAQQNLKNAFAGHECESQDAPLRQRT